MQEIEKMISIYQTGFYVCLVLAILLFSATVFVFFKFRIPAIFTSRSGRGLRRTIKEMQEINARTGRLPKSEMLRKRGSIRTDVRITPAAGAETGVLVSEETERLVYEQQGMEETVTLSLDEGEKIPIQFEIEKSIIITNSEEVV